MIFAPDKPNWARDGADWPNRTASRFVRAVGLEWHVQEMGEGPAALLLHGTGGATHSWRGLMPALAERFRVIAPDLPGHGFTQTPPMNGLSVPGMSRLIGGLIETLRAPPAIVIGHSAGAPILARMAVDGRIAPRQIVALNGAFLPFKGVAGQVFPPLAKLLVMNPLAPQVVAWHAVDPSMVPRMVTGIGSNIDAAGLALYRRLMRRAGHVNAALRMMASWDLVPVLEDLARLPAPLTLIVGARDRAVPPHDAEVVAAKAPQAEVISIPDHGHLVHEEIPQRIADLIIRKAGDAGLLSGNLTPVEDPA